MRRLALAIAAAVALALPGAAAAKEVTSLEICGAETCRTVTSPAVLTQVGESAGRAGVSAAPAAPAEFFLIRTTVEGDDHRFTWESFYVPSARVMRGIDEHKHAYWRRTPNEERTLLDSLAAGLRPLPVPEVTRATVGRRTAADPASYLALYRLRPTDRYAYPRRADWIRIRLRSKLPSPWTDGANVLAYSPSARLLERDGQFVRLPKRLGREVRRAAALHVAVGGSQQGAGAALGLVAVLPLAGIAAIRFARRRPLDP
ncbi:MAG: hypothetical protein M3322_12775 [Actinomycetota bacterium]|nr:hypothetical protein [Actinomycetota bacterium]